MHLWNPDCSLTPILKVSQKFLIFQYSDDISMLMWHGVCNFCHLGPLFFSFVHPYSHRTLLIFLPTSFRLSSVGNHLDLSGTSPVSALKVPGPEKPLTPGQTGIVGDLSLKFSLKVLCLPPTAKYQCPRGSTFSFWPFHPIKSPLWPHSTQDFKSHWYIWMIIIKSISSPNPNYLYSRMNQNRTHLHKTGFLLSILVNNQQCPSPSLPNQNKSPSLS